MTLRSLFFKLQREDLKRRLWAFALAVVVFFFTIPVACAMAIERSKNYAMADGKMDVLANSVLRYIGGNNTFLILVTVTGAVICGISGFSYLHSKKKVDFYHSIPVKRETLFGVYFIDGILIYLIPYVCSLILSFVIVGFNGLMNGEVLKEAIESLGINLLNYLMIYTVIVIAVLLTGQFFISILASIVFFSYGPIVVLLNMALQQKYFTAFFNNGGLENDSFYNHLSPITWYMEMISRKRFNELKGSSILLSLVVAFILIVLAGFLYRKRASESAGKAVSVKFLQPIIKTLITIPVGLFAGQFFQELSYGAETFWLVFGMFCGYLLSSVVIEMIYHFDFRAAFYGKRQLLIGSVLLVAIFSIYRWDILGYDRYLPAKSDIESMSIQFSNLDQSLDTSYRIMKGDAVTYVDETTYAFENMKLTDIDAAYELAKLGAKMSKDSREHVDTTAYNVGTFDRTTIYVKYNLKSGRSVIRQYYIEDQELLEKANEIYMMREYKEGSNPIYGLNNLTQIDCSKDYLQNDNLTLSKEEMQYLLTTYQAEYASLSLYDIKEMKPLAEISFRTDYMDYIYSIYPTFTNTIAFLKEHGFDCETPVDMNLIESISFNYYRNTEMTKDEEIYYKEQTVAVGEELFTIKDREQINEVFPLLVRENYVWNNGSLINYDTDLYVSVTFKLDDFGNTSTITYYFEKDMIPSFVKELVGYIE